MHIRTAVLDVKMIAAGMEVPMGIFSSFHRYRDPGKEPNVNNVSRFGEPAYSLFTSTKLVTLKHHIDVTDGNGRVVYQAETKAVSWHDRTLVRNAKGKEVAEITKKMVSLHERHFVKMADGLMFQLSNELFHMIRDITNIEELGWQLRGNVWGLNFEIYDRNNDVVAVISQKVISWHDRYAVDIYRPECGDIVVAILIALQHMICDREEAKKKNSYGRSSVSGT